MKRKNRKTEKAERVKETQTARNTEKAERVKEAQTARNTKKIARVKETQTARNTEKGIQESSLQSSEVACKLPSIIREQKDTVFRMLYRNKRELLELYNAVNGTDYQNPEELVVTTLDNAIYMNMKNDVSCVVDMRMNLYEHQSTVNPNMPLRDLFYVARLYQGLVADKDIYSSKLIKIPTPKFITFYNGINPQPERKVVKLSDAFEVITEEISLELITVQLNINPGYNEELKKKCPSLYEYMLYVESVREHHKTLPIEEAVEAAVNACIRENILAEFLRKNRSEVVQMSIFEYDEELHRRTLLSEGFEDGKIEGKIESILELLEEVGEIPTNIRVQILEQKNINVLSQWHKCAAKVESIEEFMQKM